MSQHTNPQRRRHGQPPTQTSSRGRYDNALDYSDSERSDYTDYTRYSRGSNYPQQRGRYEQQSQYNNPLDRSDSERSDYTDYTRYSRGSNYPQQRGRYEQQSQYNNSLDRSDSERTDYTPYSQASNYYGDDQYYYESDNQSYQSRGNHGGSFNSGIGTQQDLRGSFNSRYSDVQSVQSYGGDNMSQASTYYSRQGNQRAQHDNASVCGSTSATTVADGGRGRCPYQIGFHVQNAGKQMATTKRIIHFRFGFANPQALASGLAGVDCRGQEHDLSITWSITGGKRMISIDGREIQYTAGKRANSARRADVLEAAWRMADHIFDLKCYAYVPKAGSPEKRNPKWKQYNLTIDGRSFFELPEIFDLGLRGFGTGGLPPTISSSDWDQTTDISSKKSVSSGATSSQYTDLSSVKSSIQSRIEEQRRFMNKKKQDPTTVKKSLPKDSNASMLSDAASDLSSSNLMSFRSLNLSDNQNDFDLFSSGVYSAEPSELSEMRNRRSPTDEQTSGTRMGSNRTEHRQQSAPTLVPQLQAHQPQKRHQPQPSPATTEPSSSVVTSRVQTQHHSQQSNVLSQEISTQITLAPQQPPTYEEITQALVPSPFVPRQNDGQANYQQKTSSMRHQPKALPPLQEQHPVSDPYYQSQSTNSSQRSAQPAGTSSRHQSKPAGSNQRNALSDGGSCHQPQPTRSNQESAQNIRNSSRYQSQPTANPANNSSHYQSQPTRNNQRSAQSSDGSSQYHPQLTNNNERIAQPHSTSSPQHKTQPTNNSPRNASDMPINKHQEGPARQQIPGNLPKGTNKFAFF
ncbi:hypothetical protein ACHAWT_001227 [Skeletonema menzelii]